MTVPARSDSPWLSEVSLLLLGFVALVAVAGSTIWLAGRNASLNAEFARTLETKAEIVRALSLAQDAETGQRGYLLTDDQRYLAPYTAAITQENERLSRLDQLVGPTGATRADYDALRAAMKTKFGELGQTIELQRQGKAAEAKAIVDTDRGREAMGSIRRIVSEMAEREDRTIAERAQAAAAASNWLLGIVVLGLVVAGALAVAAQTLVQRKTKALARAQQALLDANVGLEAAVAERTQDLTTANEEIQRFAYIVSHDLRAPLVNVMGFTSELDAARKLLKEEIDALVERTPDAVSAEARATVDEDLPEAIRFIRTSTAKMDRLINAILRLSREGRRVVTPESVSVEEMAASIAATLHQQTLAANAEIVVERGLPPLVTDRLAVEQVFQNLMENAVKYLDRSRPGRIVVSGRRLGTQVEYSIADNGRGIDVKDHERVFELFRRAGAQDQPGEGLGLAFVRASVRRLGGMIRLTSEPGQGSTFHLSFPAVQRRPQSETRAA